MKFQVDSNCHLNNQHEHERSGEGCVDVRSKGATLVLMAKEPGKYGNNSTNSLDGNVPS